jgi:hypothetical protein
MWEPNAIATVTEQFATEPMKPPAKVSLPRFGPLAPGPIEKIVPLGSPLRSYPGISTVLSGDQRSTTSWPSASLSMPVFCTMTLSV